MNMKKSGRLWIFAILFSIGFVLQAYGTVRYVSRMPDDWVGIGLYILNTVLFGILAVGFYAGWIRQRRAKD